MIEKRNLDNSLIQWIMTQTGLGPGIGQIKYVAPATSATSQFRAQLEANGVSSVDIFTSLADAEASMVAYRNDVVLVAPGAYLETAELDWDKAWAHIMGLSGPNNMGDYYEPNATIYTTDVGVVNTLHVTGQNTQIHNLGINNAGANAACETPLLVDIYGCYFKNVGLMGNMESQQAGDVDCCSLRLFTNAHTAMFENCSIGQDAWSARSAANSGQVLVDGSQMNDVTFRNTIFKSISVTATVAMFATQGGVGSTQFGRGFIFDNCVMYNFASDGTMMNQVFYGNDATAWQPILLKDSAAYGYDRWTDNTQFDIYGNMPVADDGGGLAIELDETVAGGS